MPGFEVRRRAQTGSQYIADLRGSERSHFIATTVDLITTGVDVPILRNVVFFKYVCSPIAFQKEYLRCNHDMDTLPLAP
jgi:type I site-specific restriction endonuclease